MKINTRKLPLYLSLAFLSTSASAFSDTLWSIGKSDNNTSEFAHAPDKHTAYKKPGFFIVGKSDARLNWSYIQPGPTDTEWSSGTPQSFSVWFALDAAQNGDAKLILDINDTHQVYPPKLRVAVNQFTSTQITQKGNGSHADPSKGKEQLITIPLPAGTLKKGLNKVVITTTTGSWLTWDSLKLETSNKNKLADVSKLKGCIIGGISSPSALFWKDGKKAQELNIDIAYLGSKTSAQLIIGDQSQDINLQQGQNNLKLFIDPVKTSAEQTIIIKQGDKVLGQKKVALKKVRQWDVHLIHQTHLDIGYTHTQQEVLAMQVRHIRAALKEIKRTKDYPKNSQFKFHLEGMWAVEEFFRTASQQEKKAFIAAAKNKSIHMDVLYAQALTGLYTEEELFELMTSAKKFEKKTGIKIDTAMMSDVPGYTWGLTTSLAKHGVKYLSIGPNAAHRVGHLYEWADKPFYWVSPSGKDKVLCWIPQGGYSRFMGGVPGVYDVKDNMLMKRVSHVWNTLRDLEQKNYPYDMVQIRYAIGSDNGPPDLTLSDVVKNWNKKYASPKLIISQNSEMLKGLEERYGDKIPVVKGDLTPFWEDGCASTSKATSINRRANEKLQQNQILWSMLSPQKKLQPLADSAWQKMIMYDEHTWGAWNSISAPDSEFVLKQERYKKQFAVSGAKLTSKINGELLKSRRLAGSSTIEIYNTHGWNRSGLVMLSPKQSAAGDRVVDEKGNPVASQRLASGELAISVKDVPALGASRFKITKGKAHQDGTAKVSENALSNALIDVKINPLTGAIQSLFHKKLNKEFVDQAKNKGGLNSYLRIIGRDAAKGRDSSSKAVKISVEDAGPLVATLKIESQVPGCKSLVRRVRINSESARVLLTNTMDKIEERQPEGIYFGFPLNIPDGKTKMDIPWAVIEPEKDQLKGANRNFYCIQRWVDISNNDYGLTWVTLDAPMMQYDPIVTTGATVTGHWRKNIKPAQHFHSWVMNNHWETNYKASQKGKFTFQYVLHPHAGGYDSTEAQRTGREVSQPLIPVSVKADTAPIKSLFEALPSGIVATMVRPSRDGEAMIVRLFNTGDEEKMVQLNWNHKVGQTYLSNPMEDKLKPLSAAVSLKKFEVITLRVTLPTK